VAEFIDSIGACQAAGVIFDRQQAPGEISRRQTNSNVPDSRDVLAMRSNVTAWSGESGSYSACMVAAHAARAASSLVFAPSQAATPTSVTDATHAALRMASISELTTA
jgi:hypothetical protein